MNNSSSHIWLSEKEAADLLQPHLNRVATAWLRNDRGNTNKLPCHKVKNHYFYRDQDLIEFIKRELNPNARFVVVNEQLHNELRQQRVERRQRQERRKANRPDLIPYGRERRDVSIADRRQANSRDRRRTRH